MTVLSDWDTNLISDYEWFKDFFTNDVLPRFPRETVCKYSKVSLQSRNALHSNTRYWFRLNEGINEMMLFDPNEQMCKFFKKTYVNPVDDGE